MRTKLGVVLIIPSLAFLIVGGVEIRGFVNESTVLDDFAQQVEFAQQVTAVVHEVQAERDRTIGELAAFEASGRLGGPGLLSTAVRDQRAVVDQAVDDFRSAGATLGRGSQSWREAHDAAVRRLDGFSSVREGVRTGALRFRAAYDVYSRTVDAMIDLLAAPTPGADNPDLARAINGYVELARAKEIGSQLRGRIFAVAAAHRFAPGDYVEIADLSAQHPVALGRFRGAAPTDQIAHFDAVATGEPLRSAAGLQQVVIDTAGRSVPELDPASWWQASSAQHDLVRQTERDVVDAVVATASTRSVNQRNQTLLLAGAAVISVLLALIVSAVVGRTMARSLRVLRREALNVAQQELPRVIDQLSDISRRDPHIEVKPPSVRSGDEIGEVADAFADVHRSAVKLAVEQAIMRRNVNAMFVNLARRSQVLVERQLELLDELEREERDPELLGNLFKLDHLAARMRRNDESLLVLAGNEANRRWRAPVSLSEVILAALAEIEQYTRVRHAAAESLYLVGHAVGDVVHILAELLENATAFSPPESRVRVAGLERSGRTALVEITDEGLGMSPHAMAEANALLASPPAADVAASERMGLFVVSHLAARHGIRVELRHGDVGMVASVSLPPDVLAPAPDAEPVRALPGAGRSATVPAGGQAAMPVAASASAIPLAAAAGGSAASWSGAAAGSGAAVAAGAGTVRGGGKGRLPTLPPIHVNLTLALPPGTPTDAATAGAPPPEGSTRPAPAAPIAAAGSTPAAGMVWASGATTAEPAVGPRAVLVANPVAEPLAGPVAGGGPGLPAGPVAGRGIVPGAERSSAAARGPGRRGRPAEGEGGGNAASAWWSRSAAAAAPPLNPRPVGPPAVPIIGGVSERGLPIRVPMAQLRDVNSPASTLNEPGVLAEPGVLPELGMLPEPGVLAERGMLAEPGVPAEPPARVLPAAPVVPAVPVVPGPGDEPDPDSVARLLSSFYGGVRRAEAEETADLSGGAARTLER